MKKTLALLLCLLLSLSLLACSAKTAAPREAMKTEESMDYDFVNRAEAPAMEPESDLAYEKEGSFSAGSVAAPTPDAVGTDKIIYSASLRVETLDFDGSVAALEALVSELGGYVKSSSVNGDTIRDESGKTTVINRYANYSIAVPCENFRAALSRADSVGSVIYRNSWMENVESRYTDLETRIESLKIQRDWLMDMMEKSEDVQSLIELEARLSDVIYELESYERDLRNLDSRIRFSTIDLSLQEVEVYTPTVYVQRTFGEKIADSFREGWNDFTRGLAGFVIWFVGAIPTLLLLAVLAAGVILIVISASKKRKVKKASSEDSEKGK